MKANLPDKIQRQVASINEEGKNITLFFSNTFQLEYIQTKYSKEISALYLGKNIHYEVLQDTISGLSPEADRLLGLLKDELESKSYPKEVFETMLAMFSSPEFIKDCITTRKGFVTLSGEASIEQARNVLIKKGIEEQYFIQDKKVKLLKEVGTHLKNKKVSKQISYFDEVEKLDYFNSLFCREFVQKDLTGASYVSSSDTVSDYVVEDWVNHYPPRYYSLPYKAKILINTLCENYGLRQDIYGDMLMDFIFTGIVHPVYTCDLPNEEIPPARILFSDLPDGFSELKIQLYHDSELDEVVNLLKSKWDVIKRVQRDMLPPEKWKRASKTSLKSLERDAIVVSAHSHFRNYKETRDYLFRMHGISLSNDNLYQIIRRHNKEQEKLATPRFEYDLQYIDSMLKKPRKKSKKI